VALAQSNANRLTKVAASIPPVANPCQRETAGSLVKNPPELYSQSGSLTVNLSYQSTTDADGRQLYCFMTPEGLENPTLHLQPADQLVINITNNTAPTPLASLINPPNCGASTMMASAIAIHFHGSIISPTCGADDVLHTVVNSGDTFTYSFFLPYNQPPGLYWYHPHVHSGTEAAVHGGASGAIIIDGIQNFQRTVAGLNQQVLMIRDQTVLNNPPPGGSVPSWDLTLNNVPIAYPAEEPALTHIGPGEKQLWRVANATADSILDLEVVFDGTPQLLQIVGLDGIPIGSQGGTRRRGKIVKAKHIPIPPGGRAEFVVTGPTLSVMNASLVTLAANNGPAGNNDPQRTLATIAPPSTTTASVDATRPIEASIGDTWPQRFELPAAARVSTTRKLYFSEDKADPKDPLSPINYYITVDGATPTLFDPNAPPAIVTAQGSLEDWTIENRTQESHVFHIHQIHFKVRKLNNFKVNGASDNPIIKNQFLDTITLPFWDGKDAYPSVTLRMDFRGPDTGDFVYHCQMLGHEDGGMMAIIRVMPSSFSAVVERTRIHLVSFFRGWLPSRSDLTTKSGAAWCVRGRTVYQRSAQRTIPSIKVPDQIRAPLDAPQRVDPEQIASR